MARGRPQLDPIVKQHNNRETRRRYEEKRRAAIVNLNIYECAKHRRRVAEDSENYRFRKKQADQDEMLAERLATKQARRTDAKALRKKHKPVPPAANLARRPTPSPTPEPPFVAPPRRLLERCPTVWTAAASGVHVCAPTPSNGSRMTAAISTPPASSVGRNALGVAACAPKARF
ncbi:hypothetical protein B0H10DRAFT_1952848 [Mycena sp. CBHHK59/15]|nr:hypothetical protein B0H10DRAFT_1952848 [Mycena sp. CBHHK59/15]